MKQKLLDQRNNHLHPKPRDHPSAHESPLLLFSFLFFQKEKVINNKKTVTQDSLQNKVQQEMVRNLCLKNSAPHRKQDNS